MELGITNRHAKPCARAVARQLITSTFGARASSSITIFDPSESASCAFAAITIRLWDLVQDMAHRDVLDLTLDIMGLIAHSRTGIR
ncbi:hypothetical protein BS47DRAFT_1350948 [Hydnum rufescens UP504]|uniref:Uncharacterized protein n=1 Tax=Hydnum rufescens UP504 TaxID=1448309 RepID=A0A9P6AMB0_9AGAM|nr:hypothetical protein BS47DRAFT_1350948 [Hydnum rufescens UP504]